MNSHLFGNLLVVAWFILFGLLCLVISKAAKGQKNGAFTDDDIREMIEDHERWIRSVRERKHMVIDKDRGLIEMLKMDNNEYENQYGEQ